MTRRSGKDWYRNEQEVMEHLGLAQVPGSGSSWVAREDGENDYVLCQLKSTDANSIRVQLQDIYELQVHAAESHKLPVFAIQFRKSNDVFLLVSPVDLQEVAEHMRDPRSASKAAKRVAENVVDGISEWEPPKAVSSASKSREKFQKEHKKKYEKKARSAR